MKESIKEADFGVTHVVELEQAEARLTELGLSLRGLLEVIAKTIAEQNRITANHPRGALGYLTYAEANRFLRDIFVTGDGLWKKDETHHLEGICSSDGKIRVLFQNVHKACDSHIDPKAISEKKSGSVTVCQGNRFELEQLKLNLNDPNFVQTLKPAPESQQVYFLMMDLDGSTELSKPVISDGKFSDFLERIFITKGNQPFNIAPKSEEPDEQSTLEQELNKLVTPKI